MMSFDLALLALVHPSPSGPRCSIESRTHAGLLTPGIHIMGGALDYRWTASQASTPIYPYWGVSFVF